MKETRQEIKILKDTLEKVHDDLVVGYENPDVKIQVLIIEKVIKKPVCEYCHLYDCERYRKKNHWLFKKQHEKKWDYFWNLPIVTKDKK